VHGEGAPVRRELPYEQFTMRGKENSDQAVLRRHCLTHQTASETIIGIEKPDGSVIRYRRFKQAASFVGHAVKDLFRRFSRRLACSS
jgi:hypothetical protein